MDNIIKEREKTWKKEFFKLIEKSKNEDDAINSVLSRHLIYSSKFRTVKTRLYKILSNLKLQVSTVNGSRTDISHKKELQNIEDSLDKLKKEIKKIK
jgi:hypothetical protein